MVTILVKDDQTNQEMVLSVRYNDDETATVKAVFNPPLDIKKNYPVLWYEMASRVIDVIKNTDF